MKKTFSRVNTVISRTEDVFFVGSAVLIFGLMIDIVGNVLGRDFLSIELIPGSYQISMYYFMLPLSYCAFSYAYRSGAFPRMDFVVSRLSPGRQLWVRRSNYLFELMALAVLARYGYSNAIRYTADGMQFMAGMNLLPLWPVMWIVPIGFTLLILRVILTLWQSFLPEPAPQPTEIIGVID